MNTGRCNCGCNRSGERIIVNNGGCGCNNRRNASCANTFTPTPRGGCGCGRPSSCGCNRPSNCGCHNRPSGCGCSRPNRPSCEDRCRMQFRECMRNCRCREDDKPNFGCGRPNPCRSRMFDDGYDDED